MTSFRSPLAALFVALSCTCYAQPANSAPAQQPSQSMQHEHAESKPSTSLTIRSGDRTITLSLADLQSMPQTTVPVFNAHSKRNDTYSGPLVSDVLVKVGVTLSEQTQHAILDSYVLATGTDGYFVVYSGAELQPGLHKTQAIIAIAQSGQPLTRSGAFQLVDSSDVKPARWVRNLTSLSVTPISPGAH